MPQITFGSNLAQTSPAPVPAAINGGVERIMIGTFSIPTTWIDATDDIILLPPLPSGAVIHEFSIAQTDMDSGAGLIVDLGLTDQFGNDLDTTGADSREVFNTGELWAVAGNLDDKRFDNLSGSTRDDSLWQHANFSADPAKPFFPCLRIATAAATPVAGSATYRIRYTVN
jgi:hypothetical protein